MVKANRVVTDRRVYTELLAVKLTVQVDTTQTGYPSTMNAALC